MAANVLKQLAFPVKVAVGSEAGRQLVGVFVRFYQVARFLFLEEPQLYRAVSPQQQREVVEVNLQRQAYEAHNQYRGF